MNIEVKNQTLYLVSEGNRAVIKGVDAKEQSQGHAPEGDMGEPVADERETAQYEDHAQC